jgi:hypothetical protein
MQPLGSLLSATQMHPAVVDWAERVVTNGGALPSLRTVAAANRFYVQLVRLNLLSIIKVVCIFAPDSLIACCTPLIVGGGNVLWTNNNFIAGDLTIDGLKGNGSTKFLSTGFNPSSVLSTTGGMTLYNSTSSNGSEQDMGCLAGNLQQPIEHSCFQVHISISGNAICDDFSDGTSGRVNVANSSWIGYISANRTSTTNFVVYKANTATAHTTLGSNVNNNSAWTAPNRAMTVFCGTAVDTAQFSFSTKRLSFAAVHDGLTSSQSSDFFNAIQNLRGDIGGGKN